MLGFNGMALNAVASGMGARAKRVTVLTNGSDKPAPFAGCVAAAKAVTEPVKADKR